jgi:hypothetical protein
MLATCGMRDLLQGSSYDAYLQKTMLIRLQPDGKNPKPSVREGDCQD